jgi:hypothetical protein
VDLSLSCSILGGCNRQQPALTQLIQHIQTDAQLLEDGIQYLHVLWAAPMQMTLSVLLLFAFLGFPFVIGILFACLLIPADSALLRLSGALRRRAAAVTQVRVAVVMELLARMELIKLCGWEVPMLRRMKWVRSVELVALQQLLKIKAVVSTIQYNTSKGL